MNELIARSQEKLALANRNQKLTREQIDAASDQIKANLISLLSRITSKLASSPDDSIGPANISQLGRLTETASKLFAWPNSKPVEWMASESTLPSTTAINLALIRTTPAQLRAKARLITENASIQPQESKKLAS